MKEQVDDSGRVGQVGGPGERRRGLLFQTLSLLGWVIGALFAAAAIGAILIGWRLSEGPVRVSFLTPYIQESMQSLPDGWAITVGETYFDWDGEQGTVRIRTADVGFINAASQKVLSVPEAAFTVHGDALLFGRIEPKDLSTSGLRLVLTRGEDNSWRLGTGDAGEQEQPTELSADRGIADLARDLFGDPDEGDATRGVLGRIREFSLQNSVVSVVDQPNTQIYQIDARRLALRSSVAGISVKADTDVSTRGLVLPLRASMIYRPDAREVAGTVKFGDVLIADAVEALNGPEAMKGLAFPLSGSVGFRLSPDKVVTPMQLNLSGGEGTFALPGTLQDPLPVRSVELSGVFDTEELKLDVEKLIYDAGDFVAEANGTFQMTEEGPSVDLAIHSDTVPLLRVPAYWPTGNGRAVREWLVENVAGGTGRNVEARMSITPQMWRLPAPPREAFDVNFEFEAGTVRLPAPFDQIEDAAGKLHVTGRELAIAVSAGSLSNLALSEGVITIADFGASPALLAATFVSNGTIAETVDAVVRGPIAEGNDGLAFLLGVGGHAAVRSKVTVPLSKNARLSDADFAASANLKGVVADGLLGDLKVRAEELELKVNPEGAEVIGLALVEQSQFEIQWIESFKPEAAIQREVALNGTLILDDLLKAGLAVPEPLSGSTGLLGLVKFENDGTVSGEVEAVLDGLNVLVEGIPWRKTAGEAGALKVAFEKAEGEAFYLKGLKATGPGLLMQGDITLSEAGKLLDARLERLDVAGSALSLVARPAVDGGQWQFQMTGQRLDLRPWRDLLERDETASESDGVFEGTTFEIALEELVLTDSVSVMRAVGDVTSVEPFPTGDLRGLINGQAGVELTASSDKAGWRFTLTSDDGGSVLDAVGLGNAIRKGRMNVHGVSTDGLTMSGLAKIDDFTLTETPAFARLFSLASFTGIGEALSGRGLSFSRAEVPFTYANRRLDIPKGRMAGPSVGLTAAGYYDFKEDQLRFVGNLIPAYSITQVLGAIPLLGAILGVDQGLFGVTYVVAGSSSAPEITVNPLSALAPGILRRMFLEPVEEQEIVVPTNEEIESDR